MTLIPGDGTGPELTEATRRVLEATGVAFDWDVRQAGVDVMEEAGTPLPEETLASVRANKVALKGPITTPIGTGFRSVNVALRHELGLYACLRPCKTYPGVRSRYDQVDLVVVRENTEDLYAGIEYEAGTPDAERVIAELNALQAKQIASGSGISVKPISREGSERIIRFAFDYARDARPQARLVRDEGEHHEVHRRALPRRRSAAGRGGLPGDRAVGEPRRRLCMGLVQRPEEFDVLVLPNLYGDIVSDLTAGLVGGLGVAPGGNIGPDSAVFEATHGSAPKYKGQNKVNPTAMILSGKLMLDHLGERDAAARLEAAVAAVIAEGEQRHLRPEAVPRRPDRRRDERVRGRDHRESWREVEREREAEGHHRRRRERRRDVRGGARAARLRRHRPRRHQGGPAAGQGARHQPDGRRSSATSRT